MEGIVIVVLVVIVIVLAITRIGSKQDTPYIEQEVEEIPEELSIYGIKVEWFNTLYKLTFFEEEDGTTGYYIQDKKTHAILAWVGAEDQAIHMVKQVQQEKK